MSWLERHRAPIIAALVVVIVLGLALFFYLQTSLPRSTEVLITPPSPEICVYVEGAIADEGLYVLSEGDLTADAIEAAGGFADDADRAAVNLAAPLRDGDQVHVPRVGEVPQRVNINTAEAWLLEALPGIGEVSAQRIIEYRDENGPFQRVEDLTMVEGIGLATLEKLRDTICVR